MNPLHTMELAKLHQLEVQKECEKYQAFKGIKVAEVPTPNLLDRWLKEVRGFTLKLSPKQMQESA